MKLSKLYCNHTKLFDTIEFNDGLNVVLAEIRLPENENKDTHNLGKSVLAKVIDFCLLRGKSNEFFLFKHQDKFESFIFFIEIQIKPDKYLTIRRAADTSKHSKIAFKHHKEKLQDFTLLPDDQWDHMDVAFDKAKEMLDGFLNFRVIEDWDYRDALGYFLRRQADYDDVFKLDRFRGKHRDWKPYLAHIMGLKADLVIQSYDIDEKIENKKIEVQTYKSEIVATSLSLDKIKSILDIKKTEVGRVEDALEQYSFNLADKRINEELVNEVESNISALNERRYSFSMNEQKIKKSLAEDVSFDLKKVKSIYEDSKIYFSEKMVQDYEALVEFNQAITTERKEYLKSELTEIQTELEKINAELEQLNNKRASYLETLKDKKTFSKYKRLNKDLVSAKADIETLERQKTALEKLIKLQKELKSLKKKKDALAEKIAENINNPGELYTQIKKTFSSIIKFTVDKIAVLSADVNKEGNIEFSAEIISEKGTETSQSDGHTYKKLLCIAFDIAILASYLDKQFIHFVYHDGGLETLENRKKLKLIELMRNYSNKGLQQIITVLDTDLPTLQDGKKFSFDSREVIKILHDDGDKGRLFKIAEW